MPSIPSMPKCNAARATDRLAISVRYALSLSVEEPPDIANDDKDDADEEYW